MVKPPLRTKSIGFKVSEEEYARLEVAAQAGGCTLGEWCREVVLGSGEETKQTATAGAEAQALMAEVVALRTILLNVLFKVANSQKLTEDEMQTIIDRADSDKLRKARERLAQANQPSEEKWKNWGQTGRSPISIRRTTGERSPFPISPGTAVGEIDNAEAGCPTLRGFRRVGLWVGRENL